MPVEFNEENYSQMYRPPLEPKSKGITGLLIKMGLAKDERSANIVMIVTMIICFSLAIYVGFFL